MKKYLLSIAFLASLLALSLWWFQQSIQSTDKTETISGAYQALNFFAAQRTYPHEELPRQAHFAGWQQARQMSPPRSTTDPWQSLGPHNFAGRTLALAFNPLNPNTLYAGSASGGLWRSYSGGLGAQAWHYVSTGFPVLGVSTIAFAPADSMVMYIGTGEVYNYEAAGTGAAYRNTRGSYGMGILKTTDGGLSWSKSLDWSYHQNHGVWAIRVNPQNSDVVYAATTEGTYKSIDAGANWSKVHDVVMATDILIHPDNPDLLVVACGNFSSPGFGIYKSTDAGANWSKISSGLPSQYNGKILFGMAASQPNTIYASIGNGFSFNDGASWLCRSDDFGTSWIIQSTQDYSQWQGWFAHDVDVNPSNPDELIAVGISVWKSTQGGAALQEKASSGLGYDDPPIEGPDGPPSYVHSDCHYVLYHPTNHAIVYVANDGGIHRSTDGGETFRSCNGGMQTVQFYNGFSNSYQDSSFCLGGLQDNGTIVWNGDLTWHRVFGGDGSWSAVKPSNDSVVYVSYQRLSMLKSTDRAENFSFTAPDTENDPVAFIAPFVVAPSDDDVVYAGGAKVYESPSNGNFWVPLNNDVPLDGHPILSLAVSAQNKDVLYAATAPFGGQRSSVFVTKDGHNFTDITQNLPDRYPMDMTVDPTDEATAYITFSGYGTGHVFVTHNYGDSWEDISNNLPDVPANAVIVDPLYPSNIYVGNDLGVFASIDNGQNWTPYQEGMYDAVMIFDLKISPTNRKLRAATHGNGAFQRDLLEDLDVAAKEQTALEGYWKLAPNPSRGYTQVSYELVRPATVRIRLLDHSGRLLRCVEPGHQAAGQYVEQLDLAELAAGQYVVQLVANRQMASKKLVLIR